MSVKRPEGGKENTGNAWNYSTAKPEANYSLAPPSHDVKSLKRVDNFFHVCDKCMIAIVTRVTRVTVILKYDITKNHYYFPRCF